MESFIELNSLTRLEIEKQNLNYLKELKESMKPGDSVTYPVISFGAFNGELGLLMVLKDWNIIPFLALDPEGTIGAIYDGVFYYNLSSIEVKKSRVELNPSKSKTSIEVPDSGTLNFQEKASFKDLVVGFNEELNQYSKVELKKSKDIDVIRIKPNSPNHETLKNYFQEQMVWYNAERGQDLNNPKDENPFGGDLNSIDGRDGEVGGTDGDGGVE